MQDVWFRFSLATLGDEHLARDAAQETALRVLKNLGSFRGQSSFKTWSIGIALNCCREIRRSRKTARSMTGDEDMAVMPDPHESVSPARRAESGEQRRRLMEMMNQLTERQREALSLRFFEEMSVEETARAMDAAPGTIKATVFQALRHLRSWMEPKDETS